LSPSPVALVEASLYGSMMSPSVHRMTVCHVMCQYIVGTHKACSSVKGTSIQQAMALAHSLFTRSTHPCDCGWRGEPKMWCISGHIMRSRRMRWFLNSAPLSVCRMEGHPKSTNILISSDMTSTALACCRALSHTYLVQGT